jgi:hypothetical protein
MGDTFLLARQGGLRILAAGMRKNSGHGDAGGRTTVPKRKECDSTDAESQKPPLWSIYLAPRFTKNATIKARATCCCSPLLLRLSPVGDVASAVENALAAYSGTAVPHEYFDQMGCVANCRMSTLCFIPKALIDGFQASRQDSEIRK